MFRMFKNHDHWARAIPNGVCLHQLFAFSVSPRWLFHAISAPYRNLLQESGKDKETYAM